MKKFLLKFADSLLSKEEIRSVKGGYGGTPGGGGGGGGYPTFTLWCAKPSGGPSMGPISGGGSCPPYNVANEMCRVAFGPGYVGSSLYC